MQNGREFSIVVGFTNSFENPDTDSQRQQLHLDRGASLAPFFGLLACIQVDTMAWE